MDIARMQQLAGIIAESADVTNKVKKGELKTKDEAETLSNEIVQGEHGDVRVSDVAKVEKKPTVPKDTKEKKSIGLKEEFRLAQARQGGIVSQPNPEKQAAMAPYYAAFHQWKKDCQAKDPKCAFQGTKTGTEAVNYDGARPRSVGVWDKAAAKGQVF